MIHTLTLLTAIIVFALSGTTLADDCNWWQSKLNSTNRQLNNISDRSRAKFLEQQRNYYANSLEQCNKRNGTHQWVQTASGKPRQNNTSYAREKLRPVETDNPQLQQIIKTCNFWIQQYNGNPNDDTQAMKNTACRNADNMANNSTTAKPEEKFKPTRTLKECVKPKNVVDQDVKRCMQGLKEPVWIRKKLEH